jgi:hypothetical protein
LPSPLDTTVRATRGCWHLVNDSHMHLVSCNRPEEPLEDAPRTALVSESNTTGEQWDGFWSGQSDNYYVRRTAATGDVDWFEMRDELVETGPGERDARVLELRPPHPTRVALIVAQSPNGRRMLVGSARRTIR